ncbi:CARDB domain-containing protein, partial [Nocardioides sp.]|uniref:CARDB domain-containing protein n=1 Tax=Nocardioides sp. TaxID=35761 RepID=UPI00272422F5
MLVKTRILILPLVLLAVVALLVDTLATTPTAAATRPKAGAKPRADLVVGVPMLAARVQQGRPLAVGVAVRNAGKAKAGATTTRFALSTDRAVGRDQALGPLRATPAVRPGRSARLSARVTVP